MQFHVNHPILYIMAGMLVAVVLGQSVYFLVKALRRAKAIGMDMSNIARMLRIFGGDPDGKVHRLLDFAGRPADVADPWYSDRFDVAYADIMRGCKALIEYLENGKGGDA